VLVDGPLVIPALDRAGHAAAALEARGCDGAYTFEGPHDPFLPLVAAAEATEELELMTAVAIAFARNPMTLATQANDLQLLSEGRFHLGLGSQVRAHVERRFSMPWSAPAARMRELVVAVRSIWSAWNERTKLDVEGDFYRHTLMTPFFDPGPNPFGPPAVWLGGVGPRMTEVAGEVADGFLVHPFCTIDSLLSITLPALARGRSRSAQLVDAPLQLALPVIVATGGTAEAFDQALEAVRTQIAFYASTPAYQVVLDLHGLGDLRPKLQECTRNGDWGAMAALVPDALVDAVAIVAPPDEVALAIEERYGRLLARVALNTPYALDPDIAESITADLKLPPIDDE
jgi:probable F420-dependent oxidoreductase